MTVPFQTLHRIRARQYPDAGDRIFLDSASFGLLPRGAAEAMTDLIGRRNHPGGFQVEEWGAILHRARDAVSALLRCRREGVALAPNTSYGVNLAARWVAAEFGGSPEPGRIVLSDGEFPTNVFPWLELQREGFVVDRIPTRGPGRVDEDRLLEAAGAPGVRALAISAVQFHTGYRADLERLGAFCRDRDILFAVDGIQALGLDPIHPEALGIDVLATGAQKWLCSPWGTGFVYLSPRVLDRLRPPILSWLAYGSTQRLEGLLSYEEDLLEDARRFELHTLPVQDLLGMAHALEMFVEVGPGEVRRYLHTLHEPILEWLDGTPGASLVTPRDPARRGGILAFRLDSGQEAAVERLHRAGVAFAVREGSIRLAPHLFTTPDQMERVREILDH